MIRCVSCGTATAHGNYTIPLEEVWLYLRKYENGTMKYAICNAPADIEPKELHRAATLHWPIEQCFEECKSFPGMGHYETRTLTAWNRHMLLVMMAHLLTLVLRIEYKKTPFPEHAYG